MATVIVLGLQWGDEGKGKLIDLLASDHDHVVRCQGGNNAGHTIISEGQEYKLNLVPSGILFPHTRCYIGGGTVIDPEVLLSEMEGLKSRGIKLEGRFFISPYAHVILPYHREIDALEESRSFIGTTKRGIGPCYTDKARRTGLRMCDLVDERTLRNFVAMRLPEKNRELKALYGASPIEEHDFLQQLVSFANRLRSFVQPVELLLHEAIARGDKVILEGAQGTFLDVTFGTYPFVTSSSTIAAGIAAGAGLGPTEIDEVIGVMKAYTTRVGQGPFPTELSEQEQARFMDAKEAREYGTTTGRKRRIGWFDGVMIKQAARLNGVTRLAVTKLDVLDRLKEIKICVGYELDHHPISVIPPRLHDFERVKPIYEVIEGWESDTTRCRRFDQLPSQAGKYLKKLESLAGVPLSIISVGPDRKQTIIMSDS